LNEAVYAPTRLQALKDDARGSDELMEVFRRAGNPDSFAIESRNSGGGPASARLCYPRSRTCYLFERGQDEKWHLLGTALASSLSIYKNRDTIEGYKEYLTKFPDDPPGDLKTAHARLGALEQAKEANDQRVAALSRMEAFISRSPQKNSVEAYETYLRGLPVADPSRQVAEARLDDLRFAPYKAKGTRSAMREFVKRYPKSANAQRIRSEIILDDGGAATFREALSSLAEMETATSTGVNIAEYSRRLVDVKIQVDQKLTSGPSSLPQGARDSLRRVVSHYQNALEAWNWKLANLSMLCVGDAYYFYADDSRVNAWLAHCPSALYRSPSWNVNNGTWFPNVVVQCYWRDASSELEAARRWSLPDSQ